MNEMEMKNEIEKLEKEIMAMLRANYLALRYVRQTPERCWEALKASSYALGEIINHTREMCVYAVRDNDYTLTYVPRDMVDLDFVRQVIDSDESGIAFHLSEEKLWTKEIALLFSPCVIMGNFDRLPKKLRENPEIIALRDKGTVECAARRILKDFPGIKGELIKELAKMVNENQEEEKYV